jgi:hypothetical protein
VFIISSHDAVAIFWAILMDAHMVGKTWIGFLTLSLPGFEGFTIFKNW